MRRWLWIALLVLWWGGVPAGAQVPESQLPWREPTCGLDFDRIPSGLSPARALALLDKKTLALPGIVALVERYELAEAYPTLSRYLALADSSSSRLSLLRALATAGGGRLGEAELVSFRRELAHIRQPHEWELAFQVLGRLHDSGLEREALGHLKQRLDELQGQSEYGQDVVRRSLEDLLNNGEFRLEGARMQVESLSKLARAQRLRAEARLYAGLSDGFEEYLAPWAASRLVREGWGPEPPQQFVRQDRPDLRAEVVQALRTVLSDLKREGLPADEVAWMRGKVLQAVQQFGGKLSSAEQKFVRRLGAGS